MTDFKNQVEKFIINLNTFEKMDNVFNPWQMKDESHDGLNSVDIRCENLRKYLFARQNAKYILLAEAPGYQGCHFSGIAMTSERLMLEKKYGCDVFQRSSDKSKLKNKPDIVQEKGFVEPTATIVWERMIDDLNLLNTDFILWNAFAFHPYKKEGILTNRTPTKQELEKGKYVLEMFLSIFKQAKIIAIGNTAKTTLQDMGIKNVSFQVRHPANGGATKFREQMKSFICLENKA